MNELPTLTSSAYTSTVIGDTAWLDSTATRRIASHGAYGSAGIFGPQGAQGEKGPTGGKLFQQEDSMAQQIRIVKVFIADTNENIPLEQQLVYRGDEKLTDLTDQELYFELNMNDLLAKHNEKRRKIVDKKVAEKSGRDVYLEPARIRDLNMVVVNIASFGKNA